MNENQLRQLADELTAALDEFLKLKPIVIEAGARTETREPDTFDLYAVAGILHDLYQGIERICQRIVKEIDQRVPVGPSWHRDLLDQVSQPVPNTRLAVIQPETALLLEDYRRFRHRFHNIYGFELDWTQMKPLLDKALPTMDAFASDVEQFITFLRMSASQADEV